MLTVMIDAEKTMRVTMTAMFNFSDTQTNLRVIIRGGVCQVDTEHFQHHNTLILQTLMVGDKGQW